MPNVNNRRPGGAGQSKPFIGPVLPKHEMHPAFAQYLAPTVTERRKADPKTIEGAMAVVDRKLGLTGDRRKSVMTYLLGGGPVVSPLRLEQAIHLAENNKYDIIEDWNDEYRKNKRIGLPAPSRTAEQEGNPLLDGIDEAAGRPRGTIRRRFESIDRKEERERRARTTSLESAMRRIDTNYPGLPKRERQIIKDALFSYGGRNSITPEVFDEVLRRAETEGFASLKNTNPLVRAHTDSEWFMQKLIESGYRIDQLISETMIASQSKNQAGASRVEKWGGGSSTFDEAINDIHRRTGILPSHLIRILGAKKTFPALRKVAGAAGAVNLQEGSKYRGITERAIEVAEKAGNFDGVSSFSEGIQKKTMERHPDLAHLGSLETGWRYAWDAVSRPTSVITSGYDRRKDSEITEFEKVARLIADGGIQYGLTLGLGPALQGSGRLLSRFGAAGQAGSKLLGAGAKGAEFLSKTNTASGVIAKAGTQQLLNLAPDTFTEARKIQHTTGKTLLDSIAQSGSAQLKSIFTTQYLTGVDEDGKKLEWGDRSVGLASQLLLAFGGMHVARSAIVKGSTKVQWSQQLLERNAGKFKLDVPEVKLVLDKAFNTLKVSWEVTKNLQHMLDNNVKVFQVGRTLIKLPYLEYSRPATRDSKLFKLRDPGFTTDKLNDRRRVSMRGQMIRESFEGYRGDSEKEVLFIIGGPGSGKNFVLEQGTIPETSGVLVDPDYFRNQLPDANLYAGLEKATHPEVAGMSKKLAYMAAEAGYNVVRPTLGTNVEQLIDAIKHFKEKHNYRVRVAFVDTSEDVAVSRVNSRVASGKHGMSPTSVINANRMSRSTFNKILASKYVDEWLKLDNNGDRPIMLWRKFKK